MEKFIISYAYSGFMYLPLRLAEKERLFPGYFELQLSDSDKLSIHQLCHIADDNQHADIAVCDPHFTQWERTKLQDILSTYTQPVIIGKMIDKPPVWLISDSERIKPQEHQKDFKGQINKIRTYPEGTTGFAYASLLAKEIDEEPVTLEQYQFDTELITPLDEREAAVTSNILAVKEYHKDKRTNVVYFWGNDDRYKNSAFTGILTQSKVCAEKFPEVLQFLKALQISINIIYREDLTYLVNTAYELFNPIIQSKHLLKKIDDESHVKKIIGESIKEIRDRKFYSESFDFNEKTWNTFLNLRGELTNKQVDLPISKYYFQYPTFCLRENFYLEHNVEDFNNRILPTDSTLVSLITPPYLRSFILWYVIGLLVIIIAIINPLEVENYWKYQLISSIVLVVYSIGGWFAMKAIKKDDKFTLQTVFYGIFIGLLLTLISSAISYIMEM